jgi:DeoR family transcriptional regulator, aga operon transcriptional repressor
MTIVDAEPLIPTSGSHKRSQRLVRILNLVSERGAVKLDELAHVLNVSPATVRRDLGELAKQQLLLRTHGGARVLGGPAELPVALRDTKNQTAKQAIGRRTAAMIPKFRYAIAVGGGTTTANVVRECFNHQELTVVTNSLTIAGIIANHQAVKAIVTGGVLRPQSLELVGILAENTFSAMNVGISVLGADGVSADAGITTHDETEARTNRAMVSKAPRTIVVADGSKIGKAALAQVVPAEQIDIVVTDQTAPPHEVERLRAIGIDVQIVDVGAVDVDAEPARQ